MILENLCIILSLLQAAFAQSSRELDSLLQDYAFRELVSVRARTGVVYDAAVPFNLTGIEVAALRLRSGSLRRRGVERYKDFIIPVGLVEQPYVERIILVFHNLGNWSGLYYPLPGYTFLAPALGLLAYDATDLTATNLSELDFRASGQPVRVHFDNMVSGDNGSGSEPMCVFFGLDGSVEFDNVVDGTICLATNQGHFSIAVEQVAAPAPSPSAESGGGGVIGGAEGRSKRNWIIVGSVIGGVVLLVLLGILFACVMKCRGRKKIRRMEEAAEWGVALPMTRVGNTKAPVALQTRTRPLLENEPVP